jgi:hypothetical protein
MSRILEKFGFARTRLILAAAAIGVLGSGAGTAMAIVLPATGGSGMPTGTFTLAGETHLPAFDLTTTYSAVLSHGLLFDFSLSTSVYSNPSTGGLDFVYQLTNTGPNNSTADTFERLTLNSFANFTTDVDYEANTGLIGQPSPNAPVPGDVPAMEVDRSTNGSVVGFVLTQPLTPTSQTDEFIVRTNATEVTLGSASVIDGFQGSAITEVPAVPEPASMGLVAVSLGLLARRRRVVGK